MNARYEASAAQVSSGAAVPSGSWRQPGPTLAMRLAAMRLAARAGGLRWIAAGAGAAFALFWITVFVVGPVASLYRIKLAAGDNDVAALAERIDFESVRRNLKARLGAPALAAAADPAGPSLWVSFKAMVVPRIADRAVDWVVTPVNLTRIFAGQRMLESLRGPQAEPEPADAIPLWQRLRVTWPDASTFSVWLRNDADGEVGLVMRRDGLGWTLVDVVY